MHVVGRSRGSRTATTLVTSLIIIIFIDLIIMMMMMYKALLMTQITPPPLLLSCCICICTCTCPYYCIVIRPARAAVSLTLSLLLSSSWWLAMRARACMLRVRWSVSARVFFGSGRMTLGLCLYCALGAAALRKHCNTHSALPLATAIATPCFSRRTVSARRLMHVCDSDASAIMCMMFFADLPIPP